MSYVTLQAEQALIGAMLADEQPPAVVYQLTPEYFDHAAYGGLFTELKTLRADHPDLRGDDLLAVAAVRSASPGIDAEHLQRLRRHCPNSRHVAAYAQLVQASGFRRIVASHATRIAQAAGSAEPGAARTHTQHLAAALQRHAEVFATARSQPATWLASDPSPRPVPAPDSRAGREDALLADVMRHPEQAVTLARTLPSETFTSQQRREVYETILSLAVGGDNVDAVIVAWELDNQRRLTAILDGSTVEPRAGDPDAVYIQRLSTSEPEQRVSALDIAADLITEDLHATLSANLPAITYQPGSAPQQTPQPQLGPITGGLDPTIQDVVPGPVNGQSGPSLKP
ncbi:DnaB-like helicase N-terminal domain-containing protein [Phytomonospora endophytica]|uniref:Replicative DNA helicase n=1 Tax=Phytomonospora endophytica TaxID=714109 RepID=A0A841FVY0_9ACTN|nr:DnaB-like helicase N-terminal domain-containing protein [Phytomonospora endophytica]MBB6037692.1 replicative DNA helicase [Phytomonospora endophytica]GIG67781.1 hypothetical protein Pen01_40760 [Phytomonospora endophytica]